MTNEQLAYGLEWRALDYPIEVDKLMAGGAEITSSRVTELYWLYTKCDQCGEPE